MTTDNWINLIAAILVGGGTLFLGIMAWRAIRQTRTMQKAEKRERLLNEIIEWATELSKFNITPERDLRNSKDIEEMYRWSAPHWANLLSSKESTGESLKRRVGATWPNIGSLIEDVLKNIELTVLAIDYPKSSISPDKMLKIIKKLGKCVLELNNSVEKVIEAVDKIKASDIG